MCAYIKYETVNNEIVETAYASKVTEVTGLSITTSKTLVEQPCADTDAQCIQTCVEQTTDCSGSTEVTYDATFSNSVVTCSLYTQQTWSWVFDAVTKECNEEYAATGTSTWSTTQTDEVGNPLPGCSRTMSVVDGVDTWFEGGVEVGGPCFHPVAIANTPGFDINDLTITQDDTVYTPLVEDDPNTPDVYETERVTYSGAILPNCVFPEYDQWPDEAAPGPPLRWGQGRVCALAPPIGRHYHSDHGEVVASAVLDARGNPKKSKSQYRLKHPPTITCYLKVWVRLTTAESVTNAEALEPPAEGSYTFVDSTYEWRGTTSPCLTEKMKPVNADENLIVGDPVEVQPPEATENGKAVHIRILKWTLVEGYEPDVSDPDNPQPNGFPDWTWEPAAP